MSGGSLSVPVDSERSDSGVELQVPYLIQRMGFPEGGVRFDYMGAAEFEFGAMPQSLEVIYSGLETGEYGLHSFELPTSPNLYIPARCRVDVVCLHAAFPQIQEQIVQTLHGKFRLKEDMGLDSIDSDTNRDFLSLDNDYFFSLEGNGQRFIDYVRACFQIKEDMLPRIEAHPRYARIAGKISQLKEVLKSQKIGVTYLGMETSGASSLGDVILGAEIQEEDFRLCIWCNSNTWECNSGWMTEEDIDNALAGTGGFFTSQYYIRQKKYDAIDYTRIVGSTEFSLLLESLQSPDDIFFVCQKLIEDDASGVNEIELILRKLESVNTDAPNNIGRAHGIYRSIYAGMRANASQRDKCQAWLKKTKIVDHKEMRGINQERRRKIEQSSGDMYRDIIETYMTGLPISVVGQEGFRGDAPYQTSINFHNNLCRLGLRPKDEKLNEYVDPKTYEPKENEVVIYEYGGKVASVWEGVGNYSGRSMRKHGSALNLEEITGKKMISNSNFTVPEYAFERHASLHILDHMLGSYQDNWRLACNLEHIVDGGFYPPPKEIEWYEVEQLLRTYDLEEGIYEYYSSTFPHERTEREYREYAQKSMYILNKKMNFFRIALRCLPNTIQFSDKVRLAQYLWNKNKRLENEGSEAEIRILLEPYCRGYISPTITRVQENVKGAI